jgi:hypothetical protein
MHAQVYTVNTGTYSGVVAVVDPLTVDNIGTNARLFKMYYQFCILVLLRRLKKNAALKMLHLSEPLPHIHFLLSTKLLDIFRNCFCFRLLIFFASISIISLCLSCTVECRCSMILIMLIFSYLLSPLLSFKMFSSYQFHPSGCCLSFLFLAFHLINFCIDLLSYLSHQMINYHQLVSGHLSYFPLSRTSFLSPPPHPIGYKCSISFSRSPSSQCTKV